MLHLKTCLVMKTLNLTSTLIAMLLLAASFASAESASTLRALISAKETELTRVQNELTSLREELTQASHPSTPSSNYTYKVQSGDTTSSIARRHQITYSELVKLNKLTDPSLINIGQELIVSKGAKTSVTAKVQSKTPAPATKAPKSETHLVKRGETFYRIASINQISVGKLKELNPNVDTNRITEGQKLKVSGKPAAQIASRKRTITKLAAAPVSRRSTPAAAPKKSSTAALTRSAASKKPVASSRPTSSRKIAAPKEATVKKEVASAPAPPTVEAPMPAAPKKISSVILTNETSFSDFASKHGTSTTSLNALNGWNLPKATVLARGSEIYVPK